MEVDPFLRILEAYGLPGGLSALVILLMWLQFRWSLKQAVDSAQREATLQAEIETIKAGYKVEIATLREDLAARKVEQAERYAREMQVLVDQNRLLFDQTLVALTTSGSVLEGLRSEIAKLPGLAAIISSLTRLEERLTSGASAAGGASGADLSPNR